MEGDDIIEIKIIGSKCSNGIKLMKQVIRAVDEIEEEVLITEVKEKEKDKRYGINDFPALIINDKKISEGRVLTSREIKKLLLA